MKPLKSLIYLFAIFASIYLSSCASIIHGSTQTVAFNSHPPGAEVIVNGVSSNQITPCHIQLKRKVKESRFNKRNEYNYFFQKEGYKDMNVADFRKINAAIWGNCLTTVFAGITFTIDFITGAAYKYNKEIDVVLIKDQSKRDVIPPIISILTPEIKRGFKKISEQDNLMVRLKVKDDNAVTYVSVNGMKLVENPDGFYQITLKLKDGDNPINIKAIDSHDNMANEYFAVGFREKPIVNDIIISNEDNIDNVGNYYALIIGVEDYLDPSINDLDNPVSDAQKLNSILLKKYNFKQENMSFLNNPTLNEITIALEYYFENLSQNDNLLIFYAGHGYWDKKFKQGYWLPADAKNNNRSTWLANSTIRDYMRGIPSKHSLLITDACFGGGIFKSRDAFTDASKAINKLYTLPSRKAITSGALSEVPDKSVFVEYLIKRLDQNKQKYLSAEQLFASFKLAVINNSPNSQVPQFGEVRETGDEGGDFIFIRK